MGSREQRGRGAEGQRGKGAKEQKKNNNAQCPMPNAQCPMPNAQCPMPNAQCPQERLLLNSSLDSQQSEAFVTLKSISEKFRPTDQNPGTR
jgi:hypothetical protein